MRCKFCNKKFQKIWKVKEHIIQVHNHDPAEDDEIEIETKHVLIVEKDQL